MLPSTIRRLHFNFLGAGAAVLHFSGAIKSLPGIVSLPFNFTPPLFLTMTLLAIYCLLQPDYRIRLSAVVYLLLQIVFVQWMLYSSLWSNAQNTLTTKLLDLVVMAPLTTLIAFAVSGHSLSFRAFSDMVVVIGILVALWLLFGLSQNLLVLGGPGDLGVLRVQYQITGLAITTAANIIFSQTALNWPCRWLNRSFIFILLLVGCIISGGRAALIAFILSCLVTLSVAFGIRRKKLCFRVSYFLISLLVGIILSDNFFHVFSMKNHRIVIFFSDIVTNLTSNVRISLWSIGIRRSSLIGFGLGGFSPTVGLGDVRRWHSHNLFFESKFEGGFLGFCFFFLLSFFAFALMIMNRQCISVDQFIISIGFFFIFLLQSFTSTDLGNRMAWMWLGLCGGSSIANPRGFCFKIR